jgi:hypothetical protein
VPAASNITTHLPNYSKHLWNVGRLLPDYTPQQPRRPPILQKAAFHKSISVPPACIRILLWFKMHVWSWTTPACDLLAMPKVGIYMSAPSGGVFVLSSKKPTKEDGKNKLSSFNYKTKYRDEEQTYSCPRNSSATLKAALTQCYLYLSKSGGNVRLSPSRRPSHGRQEFCPETISVLTVKICSDHKLR